MGRRGGGGAMARLSLRFLHGRGWLTMWSSFKRGRSAMANKWAEAETNRLYDLVFKGFSSTQIAKLMLRSRNAIIGRVDRLGLKLANSCRDGISFRSKKCKSGGRAVAAPEVVAPVTPVPSRRPVEQSKEARAATTPLRSAPPPPYPGRSVAASYAVIALKPEDCRWPIGHVGEDGFHFCCDRRIDEVSPYCEAHMVRSQR